MQLIAIITVVGHFVAYAVVIISAIIATMVRILGGATSSAVAAIATISIIAIMNWC